MKIAILSDIHDNIWNLEKVLNKIQGKIDAIIFCGDMIAPFTSKILGSSKVPIYACLGNNDEDHIGLLKMGGENFTWFFLSQEFGTADLDGRKIAFCHYPKLGELLSKTGEYDAVFYGHTHEVINENYDNTILVNPGAICGIQGGKPGIATYAIYDTKTNTAEIIDIHTNLSSKIEIEKQIAKEEAIKLALKENMALTRRGLEIYGIKYDGSTTLISKSDTYDTLWQDALSKLSKK